MWWNRESKLAGAILVAFGLGVAFAGIAYFQSTTGFDAIYALFIMLFCGLVCGFILAPRIGNLFGQGLGSAIYFKRDKLERAPDRLDRMKGLVEAARYDEASAELRQVLARDFMDIDARMLLIRVRRESLLDEDGAVEICREFFDHPGHPSNHDSIDMLLSLSDSLPPDEAAGYLRRELKRGRYSTYDRKLLQNRLEAL
jgi:hypothetical protein